ncbi:hypothetical protein FO519_004373 [Halicephalobus sp. NKZ332]|nr:hypothetical protein FO519_004373 [Halicephalobus sp. NKZ332]
MELQEIKYDKKFMIETAQGNKISKKSTAHGSQNIALGGNSILMDDVVLRGDFNTIKIGKWCVIKERTIIRPAYKQIQIGGVFLKCIIGDYVMIDEDCVIEAVQIGSYVHIGEKSVIGNGVIIKDCVEILPGSVVPPNQVIPPFSVVGGNPAQIEEDEVVEQMQIMMNQANEQFYQAYVSESV